MLTDAAGVPLGLAVGGANLNDHKLARERLESVPVEPGGSASTKTPNLCLDKGYDYNEVRGLVDDFGFTAHIRSRGEEAKTMKRNARRKARRWVVQRTHSWPNRFRRLLTRWEKRPDTYVAMLHLAFAVITWRAGGLLG